MAKQRLAVTFSGTVQGVGFRYTTVRIARGFPALTGYVRNLTDGRVELIAEGEAVELREFCDAVTHAMKGHIRESAEHNEEATGEFQGFGIAW